MTESAALLDELKRDPIAKRRGPSIADAGKRSEKGFAALVKRLTKLVALRDPAADAFLVELWREHPSQKLGAALEALMLESGERALLEPIAALLDPKTTPHHPVSWGSVCAAVFALDPRTAWDALSSSIETRPEVAKACLAFLDANPIPDDPRWTSVFFDALDSGDHALSALGASLLGKARERSAAPRLLELLERDEGPIDAIAGALGVLGDGSMVPLIRAEAARRKSARGGAAKALEKLARALEKIEPSVPGPRTLTPYGKGTEIPTEDRFPFAALLVDGNVLTNGAMRCQVRLRNAGTLALPTGALVAADPFATDSTAVPFTRTVAPGRYRVVLTVLAFETEGDDVVAAATVKLADRPLARWEVADPAMVRVARATGAFFDASATGALATLAEQAPARIAKNYRGALVLDRTTGANLVSFPSGAGDGEYATFFGLDDEGGLVCVTTSFDVVRTGT